MLAPTALIGTWCQVNQQVSRYILDEVHCWDAGVLRYTWQGYPTCSDFVAESAEQMSPLPDLTRHRHFGTRKRSA